MVTIRSELAIVTIQALNSQLSLPEHAFDRLYSTEPAVVYVTTSNVTEDIIKGLITVLSRIRIVSGGVGTVTYLKLYIYRAPSTKAL